MDMEDEDYMIEISKKLKSLGIPNTPENKMLCMMFNELRRFNINIEELLSKLKKED